MKLTIELEDVVCTVEDTSGESGFDVLCEMFKGASVGVGYHPETVKEYMEPI